MTQTELTSPLARTEVLPVALARRATGPLPRRTVDARRERSPDAGGQPRHRGGPDRGRRRRRTRRPGRRRGGRAGPGSLVAHAGPGALGDPLPRPPADGRPHRGAGAPHDAGDGQAAGRGAGRGRLRRGVLPLVRRGGGPHRRGLCAPPRRGRSQPAGQAAGRPLLADHPLELPAGDGCPQARSGDRGRLRQHPQAGPADAALLAGPRADPRRGRASRTACSVS